MTDITREEWTGLVNTVNQIKTTLVGMEGDGGGLCQKVEDICDDHYKLKDNFRMLIGILIGSGVISGGAVGVIKLLGN